MLKGIDPLLNGDLLKILDEMGHGDQLLLVDRNYPAFSAGRPVVRLGESGALRVLGALLSVFPLDAFVAHPLERMEVKDDPTLTTPVQDSALELARAAHPVALEYGVVPRHDFYRRAKDVYAVVQTLESEPYSCFILHKGVVFPEGMPEDGS
ncbi:RbsD/FucU family protein [Cryptosporangium aurantiacum]|uniref:RbsD/FucU family protein n=1 Tax=Cryptosporangium aurantiacum TaxID=134849 RepID=UPI00093417BA|nr:RbsD/FucU domain-containing protein [Cryptosporangium aurantiacum]